MLQSLPAFVCFFMFVCMLFQSFKKLTSSLRVIYFVMSNSSNQEIHKAIKFVYIDYLAANNGQEMDAE